MVFIYVWTVTPKTFLGQRVFHDKNDGVCILFLEKPHFCISDIAEFKWKRFCEIIWMLSGLERIQRISDIGWLREELHKSNSKVANYPLKIVLLFSVPYKTFFMNRNSLTPYDAVVRKSKGLSSRKSFSMINIHHQKTPSPRSSLTRLDVNVSSASISSRPRSSLNIRDKNHISGPSLYSFHWRRRSTSFLQPRWAARKFR